MTRNPPGGNHPPSSQNHLPRHTQRPIRPRPLDATGQRPRPHALRPRRRNPMRAPLMHQMSSALAPETLMVSKAGIFVWPCRTTPSSTQRAQAIPSFSCLTSHFSALTPSLTRPHALHPGQPRPRILPTSPNSNPFSTSYAPPAVIPASPAGTQQHPTTKPHPSHPWHPAPPNAPTPPAPPSTSSPAPTTPSTPHPNPTKPSKTPSPKPPPPPPPGSANNCRRPTTHDLHPPPSTLLSSPNSPQDPPLGRA